MAHKRIDYAGSTNPIYFGGEWQPSPAVAALAWEILTQEDNYET